MGNMRKSKSVDQTPKEFDFEKAFTAKMSSKDVDNVVKSNPNSVAARLLKRASIVPNEVVPVENSTIKERNSSNDISAFREMSVKKEESS